MGAIRRKANVLLVEDNQADVFMVRRAFARSGIAAQLHHVSNGEEAIGFLRQEGQWESSPRPDLVIMDLNLPRKSGREVLEEMHLDSSLRRIPVIVLTSSAAESDIFDAYDRGAAVYVTKPSDPDVLTQVVVTMEDLWLVLGHLSPR